MSRKSTASNLLLLLSGSTTFTPASIAGLQLWLDASALALSNGASVSTWNDASGNGNNATQTGTARPTYATNITSNGKAAVAFAPASSQYLNLTTPITSQIYTAFVVGKVNSSASTMTMLCGNTGSMEYRISASTSFQTVNNCFTSLVGNGTTAPGSTNFNSINMSYSNPNLTLRFNGAADNTASVATTFSDPMRYVGANGGGGSANSFFNGYIAEVLVYNTLLSLSTKQQIETYLKSKWGTP